MKNKEKIKGVDLDHVARINVRVFLKKASMDPFYETIDELLKEYNTVVLNFDGLLFNPEQIYYGFCVFFASYGEKIYRRCFRFENLPHQMEIMIESYLYLLFVKNQFIINRTIPRHPVLKNLFDNSVQVARFLGISIISVYNNRFSFKSLQKLRRLEKMGLRKFSFPSFYYPALRSHVLPENAVRIFQKIGIRFPCTKFLLPKVSKKNPKKVT